ncbi:MAG: hypothetical protein ACLUE8_16090 [Lachnospiraceae bacterium]
MSYSVCTRPVCETILAAFYRIDELNGYDVLGKATSRYSFFGRPNEFLGELLNGENGTSLAIEALSHAQYREKYRLKRMVTASGLEDKTELLDLIQKYDLHF